MVALFTRGCGTVFLQHVIGTYFLLASVQAMRRLFDPVHTEPHDKHHPALRRQTGGRKKADAEVSGRGGVQCPHLALREREGERDGAMKMTDESTNGRAVIGRGARGGVKVDGGYC